MPAAIACSARAASSMCRLNSAGAVCACMSIAPRSRSRSGRSTGAPRVNGLSLCKKLFHVTRNDGNVWDGGASRDGGVDGRGTGRAAVGGGERARSGRAGRGRAGRGGAGDSGGGGGGGRGGGAGRR